MHVLRVEGIGPNLETHGPWLVLEQSDLPMVDRAANTNLEVTHLDQSEHTRVLDASLEKLALDGLAHVRDLRERVNSSSELPSRIESYGRVTEVGTGNQPFAKLPVTALKLDLVTTGQILNGLKVMCNLSSWLFVGSELRTDLGVTRAEVRQARLVRDTIGVIIQQAA